MEQQNENATRTCVEHHKEDPDRGSPYDANRLPEFVSLRKYPMIQTHHIAGSTNEAHCYRGQDVVLEVTSDAPFTVSIGGVMIFKSLPVSNGQFKVYLFDGGFPLILYPVYAVIFHGTENQRFEVLGEIVVGVNDRQRREFRPNDMTWTDWTFTTNGETWQLQETGQFARIIS